MITNINIFSAVTLTELAPILTIFVGMLAGFYGLIRFILGQSENMAEADRKERQELSAAISEMADSMRQVASSNRRIADESETRNGHLAEISVANKDQILDAVKGLVIDKQTVHHQTVEHETVQHKE